MSDSEFDARELHDGVSRFAPRRRRTPSDDTTIRRVPERLSRGEHDDASRARAPQPAPLAEPIRARAAAPVGPRLPLSATGRVAVAIAMLLAVTAVSAALLRSKAERPAAAKASSEAAQAPRAKPVKLQARAQSRDLPRPVQTVEIRPQTAAPLAALKDAPSAADAQDAQAMPSALKSWAMFPDTAVASHSVATDGANPADTKEAAAKPSGHEAKTSHEAKTTHETKTAHKAKPTRTARRARHHHHVRHRIARRHHRSRHRVRTAATPQPVQQAQAAAPPAPIKKTPIQAAIDSIFHGNGGGGDGSSGGSFGGGGAPAPVGAAFQ